MEFVYDVRCPVCDGAGEFQYYDDKLHYNVDNSQIEKSLIDIIYEEHIRVKLNEEAEKQVKLMISVLIQNNIENYHSEFYEKLKEIYREEAIRYGS